MILTHEDGQIARSPQEADSLEENGFKKCYNDKCNFFLSPEAQDKAISKDSGYYTCPNRNCYKSYDLMEDMPWHGAPRNTQYEDEEGNFEYGKPLNHQRAYGYEPGGGTRIGLNMEEQGELGEKLIRDLGALPGYGPLTWWHEGGSGSPSPLDGMTKDWGIEVKTIGYDARNHRFIVDKGERVSKNGAANQAGLKGILGVLVLLNYRTSEANVYVKEMPLEGWRSGTNTYQGVANFRSNTGYHLLEKVPFQNPFMDPHSDAPHVVEPEQDDIPF